MNYHIDSINCSKTIHWNYVFEHDHKMFQIFYNIVLQQINIHRPHGQNDKFRSSVVRCRNSTVNKITHNQLTQNTYIRVY